jgi:hypothetical protein
VCICKPSYPARKAHALYIVTLWPVWLYHILRHLINSTIFRRKLLNIKCVLNFSTTYVSNISHSKNNWARCCHECVQLFTWSTRYACQILIKLGFSRHIFEKCSNIKFHKTPSNGSRAVPCGQTDRHDEANSCFSQFFESAQKLYFYIHRPSPHRGLLFATVHVFYIFLSTDTCHCPAPRGSPTAAVLLDCNSTTRPTYNAARSTVRTCTLGRLIWKISLFQHALYSVLPTANARNRHKALTSFPEDETGVQHIWAYINVSIPQLMETSLDSSYSTTAHDITK